MADISNKIIDLNQKLSDICEKDKKRWTTVIISSIGTLGALGITKIICDTIRKTH